MWAIVSELVCTCGYTMLLEDNNTHICNNPKCQYYNIPFHPSKVFLIPKDKLEED